MAANARFSVADVVLVPFPFADQSGTKQRPAVVVSSAGYDLNRRDIVIMAITSQVRQPPGSSKRRFFNRCSRPSSRGSSSAR